MFLEQLISHNQENLIDKFITQDLYIAGQGKGIKCDDKENMPTLCNIVCNSRIGATYYFFTIDSIVGLLSEDICIAKGNCMVALSGLDAKKGAFGYKFSDFDVTKSGTILQDGEETQRWREFMLQRFGESYKNALKQHKLKYESNKDFTK